MPRRSALENANRIDQLEKKVAAQALELAELSRLVKAMAGPRKVKGEPVKAAEG